MMSIPLFQVDAFAREPFRGNPAGVCLLDDADQVTDKWRQYFASEMNLSETAYVVPREDRFELRWFTPTDEVDQCGHATLATAHVLWEKNYVPEDDPIVFDTASGALSCRKYDDWIRMNFPTEEPEETTTPGGLLESLGLRRDDVQFIGRTRFDYFIEIEDVNELKELEPDFKELAKYETRGTIVTAKANSDDFDFATRFFAPAVGIDEDPATGSAHCALGPYWHNELGKSELDAHQVSRRGAHIKVEHRDNRTVLGGQAVTVFEGSIET